MRVRNRTALRRAIAFYGGNRCVASGEDTTHWHHLDEDAANSVAENLVPLRSDLNDDIERHRRDPYRTLNPRVRPDALRIQAIATFETGDYRLSYGAARLASFLAVRASPEPSDQVLYAAGAITSLRSSPAPAFLADTLRRSILAPLRRGLALNPLVNLIVRTELAALARDYDDNLFAAEMLRPLVAFPATGELAKQSARGAHCLATALLYADPRAAEEALRRAEDLAGASGFGFGVSNAKVTLVESALERGDIALADERLADALAFCGGVEKLMLFRPGRPLIKCSWWMATDLLTLAAEVSRHKGNARESEEIARQVVQIINETRIRPRTTSARRLQRSLSAPLAELLGTDQRLAGEFTELKPLAIEILQLIA